MKKIFSVFALIIISVFALVGCGNNNFVSMASSPVVGNGGIAVAKGDYIYFVNGYVSKNDNLNKNIEGKITKSGIYRIKTTDCSYRIVGKTLYFNNGSIAIDENGNVKDAELIVSKVCGFEQTSIYIFGDYLYYTTPNNEVAKNGTTYVDDIDFCRVRLDGQNNKKLGTVSANSNAYTSSKVAFYNINNNIYFTFYDGSSKFSVFEILNKKSKEIFTTDNISQINFPKINEIYENQNTKDLSNKIFYLKNKTLCSYDLIKKQNSELKTFSEIETFNIVGNNGNYFYYSIVKNELTSVYANKLISHFGDNETLITAGGSQFTSFSIIDNRDELLAITADTFYLFNLKGEIKTQTKVDSSNIVNSYNEIIFYISSGNLYSINMLDINPTPLLLSQNFTLNENIVNNISFTNEYIYYFKTHENGNIYIQMINYKQLNSNGEIIIDQMLGDLTK